MRAGLWSVIVAFPDQTHSPFQRIFIPGPLVIGWIWTAKGQRKECSYFTM